MDVPLKTLFLILSSLAMLNRSHVFSSSLNCVFKTESWDVVTNIYYCYARGTEIFNGSQVSIDSIDGQHSYIQNDSGVKGVWMDGIPNVNYIPKNIEKHFKNVVAIGICSCKLLEVKQSDLKPFPDLIELQLQKNYIGVIEKDTFKFNVKLKVIYLHINEILHVDYAAFSALESLQRLWLFKNRCTDLFDFSYTREGTVDLQKIQSGHCSKFYKSIEAVNDVKNENEELTLKVYILGTVICCFIFIVAIIIASKILLKKWQNRNNHNGAENSSVPMLTFNSKQRNI